MTGVTAKFGFFWKQDSLHSTRHAGIRWGSLFLPSAPLLEQTVQLLSGTRSGQNWGFMLLAFVPGGAHSDIQLSLEDKKGTPGHLRAQFKQSVKSKYGLCF